MKKLLLATLAGSTPWAMAHEGHGLPGGHWHASDAWGFAVLGTVTAESLWMRRGK
jgi:hypothetical protein